MTQIFCGASDLPQNKRLFYKEASALEYRVGHFSPPKLRVLKAWAEERKAAAPQMRAIWVAWQAFTHPAQDIRKGHGLKVLPHENPQNLGHFKQTDENLRVWNRIKEQALALEASHILLETPASFTPSLNNQAALRNFIQHWAQLENAQKLIWRPAGFWERQEAAQLAQELGLILAIDPLLDRKESLPEAPEAYFQLLGRHGLGDGYSDEDMPYLLSAARHYDEVNLIFRTREALDDVLRLIALQKHLNSLGSDWQRDNTLDDFDFDEDEAFEDDDEDTFDGEDDEDDEDEN